MFITCKKSVRIQEGGKVCQFPRDYVGNAPDWVVRHWYFKALVKDGTIVVSETKVPPELPKQDTPPDKPDKKNKS